MNVGIDGMYGDWKESVKQIIAVIREDDFEHAENLYEQLKELMKEEQIERSLLEPEIGIVHSAIMMNRGRIDEAMDIIEKSLMVEPNNPELYYNYAICKQNMGEYEDAYFDYKLALFLAKDDHKRFGVMKKAFNNLCSYANVNEYQLGKSCQKMIEHRLILHEYEKTSHFLSELLYDTSEVVAKIVLCEENMLLFIMLEIVLCERPNMQPEEFEVSNTCMKYKNNVWEFKNIYMQLKFVCRRIWFGCEKKDQELLVELLDKYPVSGDMLAVIVKYSVIQDVWIDTFQKIIEIVSDSKPEIVKTIESYYNWLKNLNIGCKCKCRDNVSECNDATIVRLNCQDKSMSFNNDTAYGDAGKDPNKIAVIYCTNDELYCKECKLYLQRLLVPEGMKLEIVEVRNANSMTSGYNYAMQQTDAKYKLYIHHDTFILQRDVLVQLMQIFRSHEDIGLIGVDGTCKLSDNGMWWSSNAQDIRMNLYQDAVLNILKSVSVIKNGIYEDAEGIDGIMLATSKDIKWRDDIFDGWYFYDISQCYEFRKAGYRTVIANDSNIWLMHESTMRKDEKNLYERYRTIFVNEYMNYDFGDLL